MSQKGTPPIGGQCVEELPKVAVEVMDIRLLLLQNVKVVYTVCYQLEQFKFNEFIVIPGASCSELEHKCPRAKLWTVTLSWDSCSASTHLVSNWMSSRASSSLLLVVPLKSSKLDLIGLDM